MDAIIVSVQASRPDRTTAEERRIAERFGALLSYLFLSPRAEHLRAIEESGLSLTQVKALLVLASEVEEGAMPVRGLAERLEISVATASRALDCLFRRSLVTRTEDPFDRRIRRIAITPAGRRLVGQIAALKATSLEAFVAGLTRSQQRKLDAALVALLEREEILALITEPVERAA